MKTFQEQRWQLTGIATVWCFFTWQIVDFVMNTWAVTSKSDLANFIAFCTVTMVAATAAFTAMAVAGHVSATKE